MLYRLFCLSRIAWLKKSDVDSNCLSDFRPTAIWITFKRLLTTFFWSRLRNMLFLVLTSDLANRLSKKAIALKLVSFLHWTAPYLLIVERHAFQYSSTWMLRLTQLTTSNYFLDANLSLSEGLTIGLQISAKCWEFLLEIWKEDFYKLQMLAIYLALHQLWSSLSVWNPIWKYICFVFKQ